MNPKQIIDDIQNQALAAASNVLPPDAFANDGDIVQLRVYVHRKNKAVVSASVHTRDLKKGLKEARKQIKALISAETPIHPPVVEPVETTLRIRTPIPYTMRTESKS